MSKLPLSDIVNIIVNLSPRSAVRKGFNLGLIVGPSGVIPASERVRIYTRDSFASDMITDGFTTATPEYSAASLYFQQTSRPLKVVIGAQDVTNEETALEAVTACRLANTDWYMCEVCGAATADILAVSTYLEVCSPTSVYAYTSNDASALTGDPGSVFAQLKALSRQRSIGQFSVTPDAASAVMGYAMGANTGLSGSAFTLMFKTQVGVAPDDLNETQVTYLQKYNANYYVNRGAGDEYSMFENGVMADGTWFDEVLNLDMLVNDMQLAILDLLKSLPKAPQTEDGVTGIKLAMKSSLERARLIGFIAPGIWNGEDIWLTNEYRALATGDAMPDGYRILSEPVDNQSQADRDRRLAPPIYVPIKLAGAIHSVVVQINVNR